MKLKFVPSSRDHGWYYKDVSAHTQRVIFAQGQPVPLAVAQEIAGDFNRPRWIPWRRDFCPTVDDLLIDVMLRDGTFRHYQRAGDCDWSRHNGVDGMQDIVIFRRSSAGDTGPVDANGWHDIEVFQQANQRLAQYADRPAIEWPDEERADRDPTAIQGGVAAHDAGGCVPPVLTDEAPPARNSWLTLSLIALVFSVATAIGSFVFALLAIGHGDTTGALLATILAALLIREVRHDLAAVQEVSHG